MRRTELDDGMVDGQFREWFSDIRRVGALYGSGGGRDGTLVLQHVGSYADGAAKAKLVVIEGANSGTLKSATGDGDLLANPSGSVTLDLMLD